MKSNTGEENLSRRLEDSDLVIPIQKIGTADVPQIPAITLEKIVAEGSPNEQFDIGVTRLPFFTELCTQISLIISIILVSLQTSIVKKLTMLNNECSNTVDVFNVLAYGNLISAILLCTIFSFRLHKFRRLTCFDWFACTVGALLYSAVASCLLFIALELISQNQVSILTRLEPIFITILSSFILQTTFTCSEIVSNILVVLGVVSMYIHPIIIQNESFSFSVGEASALGAAFCISLSTIISKTALTNVSLGVFICYRSLLGSIFFILCGMIFHQVDHIVTPFTDHFCRETVLLICGWGVLVAFTQLLWFGSVKSASSNQISMAIAFGFPCLLFCAFFVNDETPTTPQWIGSAFIGVALIYGNISKILFQNDDINRSSRYSRFTSPKNSHGSFYDLDTRHKGSSMITRLTALSVASINSVGDFLEESVVSSERKLTGQIQF